VIHLDEVEADDVIATLVDSTQQFGSDEPVMIISSDKDFIQLQRYNNVKQFSPMSKTFIKESDPIRALREKILRGDSGDGIPNVLSYDSTFVDNVRQKTLSSKKVDEWIKDWDNLSKVMENDVYLNFKRNKTLIDLSEIPQDKKAAIINTFESIKTNSNILTYLISKRCSQLIECAEEFNTI
jgi:5'-3' exonuclease